MLDKLKYKAGVALHTLAAMEHLASFSVDFLLTMIDLMMSNPSGEEILQENNGRKLWDPILNCSMKSRDKEGKNLRSRRYSSSTEQLWYYM